MRNRSGTQHNLPTFISKYWAPRPTPGTICVQILGFVYDFVYFQASLEARLVTTPGLDLEVRWAGPSFAACSLDFAARFWGSKRPPPSGKAINSGGGIRLQPQAMGFPEGGGNLDTQNKVLRKISQWVGSLPGALLAEASSSDWLCKMQMQVS